MKNPKLLIALVSCISVLLFSSCKKEVSPELKVHVMDENSIPVRKAKVLVKATGTDSSRLVEPFKETQLTDNYGNAYFYFKNTVLITIVANKGSRTDSTFALLETKRQKDDENVYEKTLVLD